MVDHRPSSQSTAPASGEPGIRHGRPAVYRPAFRPLTWECRVDLNELTPIAEWFMRSSAQFRSVRDGLRHQRAVN